MKRLKILKVVNVLLILDFVLILISLLFYKYIPGDLNGSEVMSEFHELTGMIFIILGLIHLVLNYNWIALNYFKVKFKR